MAALTPGPEDAEKQENGAGDLASPTHGLKTIAAAAAVTGPREAVKRERNALRSGPGTSVEMPSDRLALGSP